jgi:hypothetical protein
MVRAALIATIVQFLIAWGVRGLWSAGYAVWVLAMPPNLQLDVHLPYACVASVASVLAGLWFGGSRSGWWIASWLAGVAAIAVQSWIAGEIAKGRLGMDSWFLIVAPWMLAIALASAVSARVMGPALSRRPPPPN